MCGIAVEGEAAGYGGPIDLMVGMLPDGTLSGITIISHTETPGLGAKITGESFKNGFAGKALKGTKWTVKKDGGDIDQITAATISSRAVCEAVKQGIDIYLKNEEQIKGE